MWWRLAWFSLKEGGHPRSDESHSSYATQPLSTNRPASRSVQHSRSRQSLDKPRHHRDRVARQPGRADEPSCDLCGGRGHQSIALSVASDGRRSVRSILPDDSGSVDSGASADECADL